MRTKIIGLLNLCMDLQEIGINAEFGCKISTGIFDAPQTVYIWLNKDIVYSAYIKTENDIAPCIAVLEKVKEIGLTAIPDYIEKLAKQKAAKLERFEDLRKELELDNEALFV